MPTHEKWEIERACRKGIEDLEVKDQKEDCQNFIFPEETSFCDEEKK